MQELLLRPSDPYMTNKIFDVDDDNLNRDCTLKPFIELKNQLEKKGHDVKTIDMAESLENAQVIFFNIPERSDVFYRKCVDAGLRQKMHVILFEPPVVMPQNYYKERHEHFNTILTWNDNLVDGKKYLKFFFPNPFRFDKKREITKSNFEKKKLLCLINANKYSPYPDQLYTKRVDAIRFMQKNHPRDFDLYGIGWDVPVIHSEIIQKMKVNGGIRKLFNVTGIRSKSLAGFPSYVGPVNNKAEMFSRYRFSICYENQKNIPGYISEKIIDALVNGNVPVYLGASNISEYIPENCFIDKRKFDDYDELYQYLKGMDEDEYVGFLENIESFLNSDRFYPFTIDNFVKTIEDIMGV